MSKDAPGPGPGPGQNEISVSLRITGRVQGVWYRGWMVREAAVRGLRGWVRNHPDGSVEAILAGPETVVEAMISACRQGPSAAAVAEVVTAPAVPPDNADFRQL